MGNDAKNIAEYSKNNADAAINNEEYSTK